jgi:hypothetical protein
MRNLLYFVQRAHDARHAVRKLKHQCGQILEAGDRSDDRCTALHQLFLHVLRQMLRTLDRPRDACLVARQCRGNGVEAVEIVDRLVHAFGHGRDMAAHIGAFGYQCTTTARDVAHNGLDFATLAHISRQPPAFRSVGLIKHMLTRD